MSHDFKELFTKVYQNLNNVVSQAKQLEQLIAKAHLENKGAIINNVYESAIIRLAIEFEAFFSKLEWVLYQVDKKYNHPLQSARKIMKREHIYNYKHYDLVHDVWGYYDALKHENNRQDQKRTSFKVKHHFKNEAAINAYFYATIVNFLQQIATGLERKTNEHKTPFL